MKLTEDMLANWSNEDLRRIGKELRKAAMSELIMGTQSEEEFNLLADQIEWELIQRLGLDEAIEFMKG